MFQFASFPTQRYEFTLGYQGIDPWSVSGSKASTDHSLLNGYPWLFAVMPRLSSALDAESSTMHPFLLGTSSGALRLPCLVFNELAGSKPCHLLVEATGFEPVAFALQTRCSAS